MERCPRRAPRRALGTSMTRWHPPRQTKIGDLRGELAAWIALQQDVRKLEIAVNNALAMHIRQATADLRQDLGVHSTSHMSHGSHDVARRGSHEHCSNIRSTANGVWIARNKRTTLSCASVLVISISLAS